MSLYRKPWFMVRRILSRRMTGRSRAPAAAEELAQARRKFNGGSRIETTRRRQVADREALIKVLDRAYLDLTTPMGRGLLGLFSGLAEDERQRIVKRAEEGRAIARKKNVKFGRKSKLTEHQKRKALQRLAAGESAREIGRDFGVSHSTIVRLKA